MFKKKKYQHSEWMKGLLEAEHLHKNEGFTLQSTQYELRGCTEYENGVFDYIAHTLLVNKLNEQ